MRVALVFTGLLRCWDQAYPSIKREILDVYNPDVFFDIWSEIGFYSGKAYQQSPTDEFVKLASGDRGFYSDNSLLVGTEINSLISAYNPKKITIENFSNFESSAERMASEFVNAYTRPKNTVSMFYKMKTAASYMYVGNYTSYDYIIRMRPDLIINSPLPPLKPHTFITMRHRNKNDQGTSDGFQMGPGNDIQMFMYRTFEMLPYFYSLLGVSCPHLFTKESINYLIAHGLINCNHEEHLVQFVTAHSPRGPYQEPV